VVEVEGKIYKQSINILIDLRSSHGYVTSKIIETSSLKKWNHNKSWLVQLATETKKKVREMIERRPLDVNGLLTWVNLNILPVGSYDVLIGMDWLKSH
jgi:hypothetical protein